MKHIQNPPFLSYEHSVSVGTAISNIVDGIEHLIRGVGAGRVIFAQIRILPCPGKDISSGMPGIPEHEGGVLK